MARRRAAAGGALPRFETPLVPRNSIAGRALIAVVAIMTFLASLTTGAVILVGASASDWQSDVAREVTIQVDPGGRARRRRAGARKRRRWRATFAGIGEVRPYSKAQSSKLLEPWLGSGLTLDELPVPRLIVVKIAPGAAPDISALRRAADASRCRAPCSTITAAGSSACAPWPAPRWRAASPFCCWWSPPPCCRSPSPPSGAMATNKPVIEVLHFVGAKNGFIAGHFQRHFLLLGLQGGALGGGVGDPPVRARRRRSARLFAGTPAAEQTGGAVRHASRSGSGGYVAVLAQIVLIAVVTALTSRHTVNRTLEAID